MSLQPAVRLVAAASLFLTGCAGMSKPTPKYDPAQSAASQAATFVNVTNPKAKSQIGRVAITQCNVVVADQTGGVAKTDAGLFGETRGRQDQKISVYYYLRGISDDQLQAMTEETCASAEASLKAAGYDVIPAAEVAANEHYVKLHEGGKTPYPFDPPGGAKFKIFMPKGQKMVDLHYQTAAGGLKMAFAAAAGNTPQQHEARLMNALKADAVHVSMKIDFAQVQGDQKGFLSSVARKDTAAVTATTDLVVTGRIDAITDESLKCWERFGKQECMSNGKTPVFSLKYPLVSTGAVIEVKDETTKGDKVAGALSTGISMLAAMGGGRGTAMSTKRKGVLVDPAKYTQAAKQSMTQFIEMVSATAKGS